MQSTVGNHLFFGGGGGEINKQNPLIRLTLCAHRFVFCFEDRNSVLCFILMLLNVQVNSYGHVGTCTVASVFVELLLEIEMNDTSSPAIHLRPNGF